WERLQAVTGPSVGTGRRAPGSGRYIGSLSPVVASGRCVGSQGSEWLWLRKRLQFPRRGFRHGRQGYIEADIATQLRETRSGGRGRSGRGHIVEGRPV